MPCILSADTVILLDLEINYILESLKHTKTILVASMLHLHYIFMVVFTNIFEHKYMVPFYV